MLVVFGSFLYLCLLSYAFLWQWEKIPFINFNYVVIYDEISSASNRISPPISLQNLVFGNLDSDNNRFNDKIPHSPTPPPPYDTLVTLSSPETELNAV